MYSGGGAVIATVGKRFATIFVIHIFDAFAPTSGNMYIGAQCTVCFIDCNTLWYIYMFSDINMCSVLH